MIARPSLPILALALHVGAALGATQAPVLSFATLERDEIQPGAAQTVAIAYELAKPGTVTLTIYSGDGDVVRTLAARGRQPAGTHKFEWDGRDDQKRIVPNEAYHPVLRCECGEAQPVVVDTRRVTGGRAIERIRPELSSDGTITFDLPQSARTLVRVGFKGGAMMRAVDSWSARAAGRVRVEWDGFDQSGTERLLGQSGLTVLVTAFTLPDYTIIVSGNDAIDYFAYRKARGWQVEAADAEAGHLDRDGKRLARQASLPRSLLRDPRVTLQVVDKLEQHAGGALRVKGPITLRVDMAQEDKWLVQQSLYEVGFFLDHEFVSEEETGYTPISWRWDPAGVAAGEHTMTVNISGFWGQVGVASIRLWIDAEVGGAAH